MDGMGEAEQSEFLELRVVFHKALHVCNRLNFLGHLSFDLVLFNICCEGEKGDFWFTFFEES